MRTLGIDLGTRRVGLALSDAGGTLATPYEVVSITAPAQATARVMQVIEREGVERLVVGLPINMDDTLGTAAKTTIAWGRDLSEKSGKPVVFVDERLSSFQAEQDLIERKRQGEKLTRKRQKQQQDALAASSFLQSFLDGRLSPVDVAQK